MLPLFYSPHIPSTKHRCVFVKIIRKRRKEGEREGRSDLLLVLLAVLKYFKQYYVSGNWLCRWEAPPIHTHSHSTVLILQWPKCICTSISISLKHLLATGEKKGSIWVRFHVYLRIFPLQHFQPSSFWSHKMFPVWAPWPAVQPQALQPIWFQTFLVASDEEKSN